MKTLSLRTLFLQLVIIILIFQPIALGYTKRNLKNVSVRGRKNLIIDESIDLAQCDDIAIIGAGIAGTYAAWRLRHQNKRISIYEFSDRVGGRMFTVQFPDIPDVNVELGGMRYYREECYEIDEAQIRHVVDLRVDDVFICNQCVITLKAVFTCETKLKNLLNNIKKSASPQFIEFANKFQTVVDQDEDEYPAINTIEKCPSTTEKCPTTTKKRALHAITPSKSGCTPRGKRNRFSTPSKGARRRQLKFQTPKPPQTPKSSQTPSSCRKLTETSNLQSPGPKVKVTRNTKL
ncbi:Hypothetical predicted protein [Mytilus galloprovincialis]|uniref:Amine oxidase domain-containing protein n=1 Tax=Mytilus galloprovincialis TaxID=29158 RepID=A0A8B6GXA1_MYTGA|nr:Hypothetical predicted protein [Mytilus galloprovincialis]